MAPEPGCISKYDGQQKCCIIPHLPRFELGDKRGTPTNNDAYYTFNLKFGFRLTSTDRYGNSTKCPIRF